MLLIPEIETVVILVPRAGSTSIKNAVLKQYPKAMLIYRHMEADGVPHGYDRWPRVGVVRHPVHRLWSLYKYLRDMRQEENWSPGYADRMRATVQVPFSQWLLENTTVFTEPYTRGGMVPGFWPKYSILHSLPETRKSQFLYLRPDLGTQVFRYNDMTALGSVLGVTLGFENTTPEEPVPEIDNEAMGHLQSCFAWDFKASTNGGR